MGKKPRLLGYRLRYEFLSPGGKWQAHFTPGLFTWPGALAEARYKRKHPLYRAVKIYSVWSGKC